MPIEAIEHRDRPRTSLPRTARPARFDPWQIATITIVQAAIFLAGYNMKLAAGASFTLVIMLGTLPVWWRVVGVYSLAPVIVVLTGGSIVWGLYLAELSRIDHVVSRSLQMAAIVHLLNGLALMLALLWGRLQFPLHRVAALYGSGALVDALLNSPRGWKFDLGVPMVILVVGWLGRYRSQIASIATILAFGAIGIFDEGRSYAAFCVAAASLVIWQMRPTRNGQPTSRWYPIALLTALMTAIYSVAAQLLTSGYFGPDLQRRSAAQIDATGSLISGGRPEWAATRALMQHHPRGYGVGVVPDLTDHATARSGLASINVETGGYLTNYMMGGQFRLHSVASDLWVGYGVVGIALALTILYAVARSMSTLLSYRRAPMVVVFMCLLAIWHLAFGPIFSNWPDVCAALGLALLTKSTLANTPAESVDSEGGFDVSSPDHQVTDAVQRRRPSRATASASVSRGRS